jgi:hypothetical protein
MIFWWTTLLLIQQTERLFLLPETLALEPASKELLLQTLWTGFRADAITASFGVLLALCGAFVLGQIRGWVRGRSRRVGGLSDARRSNGLLLTGAYGGVALLFFVLVTVDMGYYRFTHQHLNFVFFEYVGDLAAYTIETGGETGLPAQQTTAELKAGDWGPRVLGFFLAQTFAVGLWSMWFRRRVEPTVFRWKLAAPLAFNVALTISLVATAMGFDTKGAYAIRIADINSAAYYTLAQNPLLYAGEALRATVDSRLNGRPVEMHIPAADALRLAQQALGRGEAFPYDEYPLVHTHSSQGATAAMTFPRPANVLLIVLEALDRRFLGKTVSVPSEAGPAPGIRLTPFLDKLKDESFYFEHFFSNGVQTARGLFSTFCSYFPRQGAAAMKTLYTHDYVCLPSVLRNAGYQTEMVISQHRDLNRLQLFMSRNGLHRLLGEQDFPADVERAGGRITDGALFELFFNRVSLLQRTHQPFFLMTHTLGAHHPFTVPGTHPEVRALQEDPDGYLAALRYADLELERLFNRLLSEGLLANTMVVILGDHGRHEPVGETEFERQVGHFVTPLLIWVDPSLRNGSYKPRTISVIASQVDLTPTILAMNRLTPRVSPFVGRDVSCLLLTDCAMDNFAYLSSVYDDLIGLAEDNHLLVYSLRMERLVEGTLDLTNATPKLPNDPSVSARYRRLLSLYAATNAVLDRNAVWSWTELRAKL